MILIVDVETTGTDPYKDHLIEVAAARYHEQHGLVGCASWLVAAPNNDAYHINGIDQALLLDARSMTHCHEAFMRMMGNCRAIVAHNASFDKQWLPGTPGRPWVCSQKHIEWPVETGRDVSLERLSLAHGLGVVAAHRAISDVMTLVRVFDQMRVWGSLKPDERMFDVEYLIDRALRPRAWFEAIVSFDDKDLAKNQKFEWHPEDKSWRKELFVEDAPRLEATWGFPLRQRRAP